MPLPIKKHKFANIMPKTTRSHVKLEEIDNTFRTQSKMKPRLELLEVANNSLFDSVMKSQISSSHN